TGPTPAGGCTPSPTPSTPRNPASRLNKLMDFLAGPNSPVAKYTPEGWDADSVFDVRAVVQQLHLLT
ncbi:MAG: hypothetical protein WCG47_09830, partial [Dermatophilaceae bacterium]